MRSSERLLIRSVEVGGTVVDCRIADGRIAELGVALPVADGERVLDGAGGALIPGLADHHVHVLAAAANRASVDLGGAPTLDQVDPPDGTTWLRVVAAGAELSRDDVDARWPDRPVRVQHRSGALWTLNSRAIDLIGPGLTEAERRTGQLWRADQRLRTLLQHEPDAAARTEADVARVGRDLASFGVTHVTDASPDLDESGLALIRSAIPQTVVSMAASGDGPRKIVISDHDVLDVDALTVAARGAHADGRPVAFHAASAMSLAVALAVFAEAGMMPGDRIEHAAVCDDNAAARLAELGIVVVTQPTIFARRRDDFLRESPPEEHASLWRHAGLVRAGVRVVASSDAPYGDLDPAQTVFASAQRPGEGMPPAEVLTSYLLGPLDLLGTARTLGVGAVADLCLLASGLDAALTSAASGAGLGVRATFAGGRQVFGHGSH